MSDFNFKKIGGRTYKGWKEWEENQYVVGRFTEEYEDQYGNPGYEVEVIETDLEGVNEGDLLGLNSCGSLNHKMKKAQIGDIIKVIYAGKDTLEKGKFKGKEFHSVEFFLDDSNRMNSAVKESSEEAEEESSEDVGL